MEFKKGKHQPPPYDYHRPLATTPVVEQPRAQPSPTTRPSTTVQPVTQQPTMMMAGPQQSTNVQLDTTTKAKSDAKASASAAASAGLGAYHDMMLRYYTTVWSTSVMGCCEDVSSCILGCCCWKCYLCYVSDLLGEFVCLPMVVPFMCPTIQFILGLIPCLSPLSIIFHHITFWSFISLLRTKFRGELGIRGSMCNDVITTIFCPCCVVCQIKREYMMRYVYVAQIVV